jgi:hypothetical protein
MPYNIPVRRKRMNIFGFITIGLVLTAVLLIYYVEIPRLRKELIGESGRIGVLFSIVNNNIKRLDSTQAVIKTNIGDLDEIKSARGTFSRQLGELSSRLDAFSESAMWKFKDMEIRVHSISDIVDENTDKIAFMQVYLDSQKKPAKKKKSGK